MPNPAPIFIIKYNEDDKNVENYKIYNNNPGSNIKQYVSYNQGSQKKQVKDVSEAFELMAKKDVAEDFQETFREKVAGSFTKLLDVSNKELDIKEADKSKNDIERYKDYIKKVDKNVEIEEENDFLKTEVSKNTKLNEELKTKNEELSSQNSKLDKEISEKQTKLKKADDLMSEYKDAIRILQEKLEKQQNIINNLIEEDKKIPVFVQRIFGKKDNNKALPESSNER